MGNVRLTCILNDVDEIESYPVRILFCPGLKKVSQLLYNSLKIHYRENGCGYEFEQEFNNGDHLKTTKSSIGDDVFIRYFKKDFGDYKVTHNDEEGTIIYDNGQIFKGDLIFLPEDVDYLKKGDRYSSFYNCEILKTR